MTIVPVSYTHLDVYKRQVMACIGGIHCIKANINTQDMAKKIEQEVFPSHYHIKAAVAGCPNDCAKGHFNDFGIIGLTKPTYHSDLCIGLSLIHI